jgi:hypothetical protein
MNSFVKKTLLQTIVHTANDLNHWGDWRKPGIVNGQTPSFHTADAWNNQGCLNYNEGMFS